MRILSRSDLVSAVGSPAIDIKLSVYGIASDLRSVQSLVSPNPLETSMYGIGRGVAVSIKTLAAIRDIWNMTPYDILSTSRNSISASLSLASDIFTVYFCRKRNLEISNFSIH